jgi:hypothetical protein
MTPTQQSSGNQETIGNSGNFIKKIPGHLSLAMQYALVSLFSFVGALYVVRSLPGASNIVSIGALWAMISGIIVMQDTCDNTMSMAHLQVLGAFIGAVVGAIYLSFFPFSPLGMALLIGITVLICVSLNLNGPARLAALTVGVVLVFSTLNPDLNPLMNAGIRFIEVLIGSTIAIVIVSIWPYITKRLGLSD